MKQAAIGTLLIIFALFCTPMYIEPTDIVVSTAYITALYSMLGDIAYPIIIMWAALGYCCMILGVAFVGHSLTKYIPILKRFHGATTAITSHPYRIAISIFGISLIFSYILMLHVGLI